jgi:hypothetical protein
MFTGVCRFPFLLCAFRRYYYLLCVLSDGLDSYLDSGPLCNYVTGLVVVLSYCLMDCFSCSFCVFLVPLPCPSPARPRSASVEGYLRYGLTVQVWLVNPLSCGLNRLRLIRALVVVIYQSNPVSAQPDRRGTFLVGRAPISHTLPATYLYRTGLLPGAAVAAA